MRIEVVSNPGDPNKVKGDLLQNLATDLLTAMNYSVTGEVRTTAAELDLDCVHNVNQSKLYVECKAHTEPLSANALHNILGKVEFLNRDEGWLVSAGPLGKDAKGFQETWESKPQETRRKLSIYSPERIIQALCRAKVVKPAPQSLAEGLFAGTNDLGDWLLLLSPQGRFWAIQILKSGVPHAAVFFDAVKGSQILDTTLLRSLKATSTSLSALDFEFFLKIDTPGSTQDPRQSSPGVVQVQSGEDWRDYRPARPEFFVGRVESQSRILRLLTQIAMGEANTRIFAITGDSGLGKSSLIAKLKERCRNIKYRNRLFMYAVDVRAATASGYVAAALIKAIQAAAEQDFLELAEPLRVTDYADPLSSTSIVEALSTLQTSGKLLVLVFDQFEEMYSKPDHFCVFEEAQRLFLSAVAARTGLALGFAWKSDNVVQQGHPAYFMWHRLADLRYEVQLRAFSHAESSKAITTFEKEAHIQLRPDLRRQIIENSQGYPWLLKKLCIHLWDQILTGVSQEELADTFDTAELFQQDLGSLSAPELNCIKQIAKTSPSDWFEMLDTYGDDVVRSLLNRRLIVRSGDRLILYWDIFRDYVLTNSVPPIPFTYLPSSPSIRALLSVAVQLRHHEPATVSLIAENTSIKESTCQNVVHDLLMFGVATGTANRISLDERVAGSESEEVLLRLRQVLGRHALTVELRRFGEDRSINLSDIVECLRSINRAAQHRVRTWKIYGERMARWLMTTGYLVPAKDGWRFLDRGGLPAVVPRKRRAGEFLGESPPNRAVEAASWLMSTGPRTKDEICMNGHRNGVAVLLRLKICEHRDDGRYGIVAGEGDLSERIWVAANENEVVGRVVQLLDQVPNASRVRVASVANPTATSEWTLASKRRVGTGLAQWAKWVIEGRSTGVVPEFTSVKGLIKGDDLPQQRTLFGD